MVLTEKDLQSWRIGDLRKYLSDRGVPVNTRSNRKEQLIEKIILAQKLELPTLPSQADRISEIDANRKKILFVDGVQLPFPETICSHWLEGSGYFPDLTIDLIQRYAEATKSLKASKEGQNLQTSGHVQSVFFNRISDAIKCCFIKALVVPQTRISEAPYSVWVCLRTDSSCIVTGECECVAGFSNTCKHVFSLLYYIQEEVRLGRNKSCTGKKQQWSVRKRRRGDKIHEPCQMSAVDIGYHHPENEDCIATPSRSEYEPRSRHDLNVTFSQADWEAVAEATDGKASVLQFFTTALRSSSTSCPHALISPPTLPEIVSKCHVEIFHAFLKQNRSAADLESINKITADQVSSDKWFQYRHGVITASFAHDVLLKVDDNLQISNISSSQNLCAKLCMYNPPIHSAALNWGITNEKFAFKRYIRKNRTKHKNFSCKTTGLFITEHYPFLGASPDGVLSCKCCGFGVLEIKCPWKSRDITIAEYIIQPESCLSKNCEEVFLKPKHRYYAQVQHQMFVTGAMYCDFEVFLPKESITIRISKDPNYEINQVPKLIKFFNSIVLPESFSGKIANMVECRHILKELLDNVQNAVESKELEKDL